MLRIFTSLLFVLALQGCVSTRGGPAAGDAVVADTDSLAAQRTVLPRVDTQTGDGDNRRFWLQKKIELHRSMGKQADRRATYLAAGAQFVFAEDERARFDAVRLTRPLKSSLKQKQRALKRTVAVLERVAEYQVEEFSTASTFHIADLYTALSHEIIASERPEGLTELELEQYEILLEEQAFQFSSANRRRRQPAILVAEEN